jgi:hypothetical protein
VIGPLFSEDFDGVYFSRVWQALDQPPVFYYIKYLFGSLALNENYTNDPPGDATLRSHDAIQSIVHSSTKYA